MPTYFKLFIFFGVVFVVAGIVTVASAPSTKAPAAGATAAQDGEEAPYISFEKFYQLQEGMSYEEVVGILGVDGDVIKTEDEAGEDGELVEIVTYQWFNIDGSNMTVTLRGGALESKYQYQLK